MSHSQGIAQTPEPPYYAVIFTSQRSEGDRGYGTVAERMVELAKTMPGYLGVESVRGTDGLGVTISYWRSEEDIRHWKANAEHLRAQKTGNELWYEDYAMRIARVERSYTKDTRTAHGK